MTDLTVRLTDTQAEQLAREAQKLGVTSQDLLRAAVLDPIEGRDEAFLATARRVVEKNVGLYQRLA